MKEAGYRSLKKRLNKYHNFSFKMPRKGKELTSQQKSAITRIANKLMPLIQRVESGKGSFVRKPKGVSLKKIPKTAKSNTGSFFPYPGAKIKIKKEKGRKKASLEVRFRQLVEKYFPFPDYILGNMELIQDYVEVLKRKYKPHYIMWSVNEFMGRARYDPELFNQYAKELLQDDEFEQSFNRANDLDQNFLTGVFLGYEKD